MDFYTRFTEHFRGEKSEIKRRLSCYIPILKPLMAHYPDASILDLGSGRGEWLELLKEQSWTATGIDMNADMAADCQQRGLSVEVDDALSALQKQPAESLIAVSGFHIAEHLGFPELQALITEAHRVLMPGGLLILETPNPENLTVGLWSFYLDPTHRHPLPPPLLHFTVKDAGFSQAHVLRLNGPVAPHDGSLLTDKFDWMLSAYPDYAIVGHKAHSASTAPWFDYVDQLQSEQQTSVAEFAAELEQAQHQLEKAQQQQEKGQREQAGLRVEKQQLEENLQQVLQSRSWRITQPLRSMMHLKRHLHDKSGSLMRRMAQVPWLKRLVLRVLDRMPALKMRVLKIMATGEHNLVRTGAFQQQDFIDLETRRRAAVAQEAFRLRDEHFAESRLARDIQGLRLEGHINGSYSLAAINRHLLLRLHRALPSMPLWLVPHEGEHCAKVTDTPGGSTMTAELNALTDAAPWQALTPSKRISLYHHYPLLEVPEKDAGTTPVALFFWEESWVPVDMVATLNQHYAGVIVTSWFVKKVLMDSGCCLPVHVVALPLVHNLHADESHAHDLSRVQQTRRVDLLHVSSAFPRKGVDILLRAFDCLASEDPQLHLTIKTFPNPHNQIDALIERWVVPSNRPRLDVTMDDYDTAQMAKLYQQTDIVVLPTRGEGLNMPAIEAGEFSRGLVVTGQGAHTDFAVSDASCWIGFCFDHAQSHFSQSNATWAEPGLDSTIEAIRTLAAQLRETPEKAHRRIQALHDNVHKRFFSSAATASTLSALARLQHFSQQDNVPLTQSVSLFSSWAEPCGIAQYSEHMVKALRQCDAELDVTVMAPQERMNTAIAPSDIPCQEAWRMSHVPPLAQAVSDQDRADHEMTGQGAAHKNGANIVWLQHHFAFYPLNDDLRAEVQTLRARGHCVYITLHTTQPLIDFDAARRGSAADALSAFDRVFVHTLSDLNHLKRIGVVDNVTQMHQGVVPYVVEQDTDKQAHTVSATTQPPKTIVLGSFGFLLPHKGIYTLIKAFSQLRGSGVLPSDATLRLVTTVRDEASSREELARCEALAKRLNVEQCIEWQTAFLPLAQVQQLLSECDAVVLPYQHTQESSSAAVRTAVAACPTILTTPAPIFDEVRGVAWQSEGFAVNDVAESITHTLQASTEEKAAHHKARDAWLEQRSWQVLGESYNALFRAALRDRQFIQSAKPESGHPA